MKNAIYAKIKKLSAHLVAGRQMMNISTDPYRLKCVSFYPEVNRANFAKTLLSNK